MRIHCTAILVALLLAASARGAASAAAPFKPNIVYILADDLGYGDVQCLNPKRGKIATPRMDRLAAQGTAFTDAHSGSSVCSPTRYGLLTGRYAWRTRLQQGVLNGLSKPLIAEGRLTVGKLLQSQGYHTACVGKWHLGMDWPGGATDNPNAAGTTIDYSQPVRNGPVARGFDFFYGITASLDMPPFIWIENDRTVGSATARKTFLRAGPAAPDFEAVDVLPGLVDKARHYLQERAAAPAPARPFFLYLPLTSPHTPIVPGKDWAGKSGLNPYADFVMQTDWAVGQILDALDQHGLSSNTLVVFTSDNGCSPVKDVGVPELERLGHFPSAQFRGYKSDIWDGGHRVPFIVRWPGVTPPGRLCDQLICLTDFFATCADILGAKLPDSAAEDSVSILSLLKGASQPVRDSAAHHSIQGLFAIREGSWKLDLCPGSGGWTAPGDAAALKQGLPAVQLYDLSSDPGETRNAAAEHPDVVERLAAKLQKIVRDGRSTPGAAQSNDVRVNVRKNLKTAAKTPPNFLFILTDDQRFDAMGAAGCREIQTPVMDQLAAGGLRFTQATIMGANNAAVCLPSRSMILTGTSLFRCKGVIATNTVTLPELFRQNGYATFATGKWHNDANSLLRSFEFGSALFQGGMSDHFKTPVRDIRAGRLSAPRQETNFDAQVFASAAVEFLSSRPQDKPFFAWLAFKTPHDPRIVPTRYHQRYDPAKITAPPNFLPRHPFDNGELKIRDEMLAGFPRTPLEVQQHLAAYYAATTATDDQIGRVLAALDTFHLSENTVVVFTGDNGLALGQHGLMGKQNVYDHSIRVPLILRGPGIPKGKESGALCQLFDLYPTLAAMAGLQAPRTVDGKDLAPVWRGETRAVRPATLHAYKDLQRAVRTRDAKLIEYLVKGQRTTQLFDLKADPWETNNLAADPAHAARLESMQEQLKQLAEEYAAPPFGSSPDGRQ